jgi:hypothetical protein
MTIEFYKWGVKTVKKHTRRGDGDFLSVDISATPHNISGTP